MLRFMGSQSQTRLTEQQQQKHVGHGLFVLAWSRLDKMVRMQGWRLGALAPGTSANAAHLGFLFILRSCP